MSVLNQQSDNVKIDRSAPTIGAQGTLSSYHQGRVPRLRPSLVQSLEEAALSYLELQLPITLCSPGQKRPIFKGWPTKVWRPEEVEQAFRERGPLNVGLVLGPRSGIIDVECDGPGGEQELLKLFDGTVPVTPLWRSARGPHRLFKWDDQLNKVGNSSVRIGALEIRLGADNRGAHSLLPPSITDGWGRTWGVSLDDCNVPPLPSQVLEKLLATFGRRSLAVESEREMKHSNMKHSNIAVFQNAVFHSTAAKDSQAHSCQAQPAKLSAAAKQAIGRAIDCTLPGAEGHRNRVLFQFARQLKGIPELATADAHSLRPYVEQWHAKALSFISTKDFETTWQDFLVGWERVQFPAGTGPLDEIYKRALCNVPAAASRYKKAAVRNLVAFCCQLQAESGDQPFYLACRAAATVTGISPTTISRYFWKLIYDGFLKLETAGERGRAAEYRYLK